MTDANMLTLAVETYQRLLPELRNMIPWGNRTLSDPIHEIQTPTLGEVLQAVQPIPPQTCLVGICEDNVPFLLDLTCTDTGSLLITGDPRCGKTGHLKLIAESAICLNSPHELQVAVITNNPAEWANLQEIPDYEPYFLGVCAWYEQAANDMLNDLVSLGEARSSGRHPGPSVLLIIDDLPGGFDADFEIQNGLHWLLEYGSYCHIRTVASINAELCPSNPFWIDTFRTFLIGKISSDSLAQSLGLAGVTSTKDLVPNHEFSAFTGQSWTRYRLPIRE